MAQLLAIERNIKYNYCNDDEKRYHRKDRENKKKIISASEIFDSDYEIEKKYALMKMIYQKIHAKNLGEELAVDAIKDTERLTRTINSILSNPKNWIISDIKKDNYKVEKVELKPLDIASYCKSVFEKGSKVLIMSATILNNKAFCKSIGLNLRECKIYSG